MKTNRDFIGEPPFCAAGCGFYGAREHHGLCSKFYAAFLRDQVHIVCNKHVGLLGFECGCGDLFCRAHRYPEEHGCDVDFRTAAKRRLSEKNPLCRADKMDFRI
ncbi:hypothetical protein ACJRO7_016266 [Eucalyptus globulus]|uniref:AN1-type domain-containing protein n=1 Tax=Eucalyptus globulus TaxID=34317 RepID=A0ABD3L7L5_EUCGL